MTRNIERTERGARPKITEADRRQYSGIARHPLGRRWLWRSYHQAVAQGRSHDARAIEQRMSRLGMDTRGARR